MLEQLDVESVKSIDAQAIRGSLALDIFLFLEHGLEHPLLNIDIGGYLRGLDMLHHDGECLLTVVAHPLPPLA